MIKEQLISSVVEDIAGHDVLPLIDVLKDKKNVSEFTLAEELKEEINTIRNKLYRLYDYNLVEFTRKKDKEKGWYIYYWTFVPSRIPRIVRVIKKKKLEKLKLWLVNEQNNNFFECANKCVRLKFDKAIDFEFKCPECGSLMNQEDNKDKIEHIKKEIAEIENELSKEVIVEEYIEEEPEPKEEKEIVVEEEAAPKMTMTEQRKMVARMDKMSKKNSDKKVKKALKSKIKAKPKKKK